MKRNATQKDKKQSNQKGGDHAGGRFLPVVDSRKRKVRGLWQRNGRFYAQMRVAASSGKSKAIRVPLDAIRLDDAIAEMEKRRTEKRSGEIHLPGHRPQFSELVKQYRESVEFLSKKPMTQGNETQSLNMWIEEIGGKRIDWIKAEELTRFRDQRAKVDGVANRTININVTAFNNAMKYAVAKGWVTTPPKVKKLKEAKPPKRPLLTRGQIDLLLKKAGTSKNADLMRFYIRFLVTTGCREQEALKIRKVDVDMKREVVFIGWDGDTKNRQGREIQFNDSLRGVLTELLKALPDDTTWLFPSPQRGKKDAHAKSLRESFYLIRKEAKLDWVGFHDFRHFFASSCVMAGIDFMTIAGWLGHQDGGILVAKVYGHLNDAHQRTAAAKLKL